ncbi:MAG: RDD family protein [Cyanobacteria bacterium J06635_1]
MSLFNTVNIQTPESVELEFTLAGIGSRALALFADYFVLTLASMLLSALSLLIQSQLASLATLLGGGTDSIELWLSAIAFLALSALYMGYFVGFESAWQGQTPGKRWTKIRVIRDNGKPEGVLQATLRSLLRPVDDILFLGFFCIIFGKQEKRLGDWLAGTLVVQNERPVVSETLYITDAAKAIASELDATASFGNLLPDDFAVIREYLQRRPLLAKQAKDTLSLKLARDLKQILDLENLPQEMTADTFIESVYWAYQQDGGR